MYTLTRNLRNHRQRDYPDHHSSATSLGPHTTTFNGRVGSARYETLTSPMNIVNRSKGTLDTSPLPCRISIPNAPEEWSYPNFATSDVSAKETRIHRSKTDSSNTLRRHKYPNSNQSTELGSDSATELYLMRLGADYPVGLSNRGYSSSRTDGFPSPNRMEGELFKRSNRNGSQKVLNKGKISNKDLLLQKQHVTRSSGRRFIGEGLLHGNLTIYGSSISPRKSISDYKGSVAVNNDQSWDNLTGTGGMSLGSKDCWLPSSSWSNFPSTSRLSAAKRSKRSKESARQLHGFPTDRKSDSTPRIHSRDHNLLFTNGNDFNGVFPIKDVQPSPRVRPDVHRPINENISLSNKCSSVVNDEALIISKPFRNGKHSSDNNNYNSVSHNGHGVGEGSSINGLYKHTAGVDQLDNIKDEENSIQRKTSIDNFERSFVSPPKKKKVPTATLR